MANETDLPASDTTTPLTTPIATNDTWAGNQSQLRNELVEVVHQEPGQTEPNLSQSAQCREVNSFASSDLAPAGEVSQTAAEDWLDKIFGDGTNGQDFLQAEALTELFDQQHQNLAYQIREQS